MGRCAWTMCVALVCAASMSGCNDHTTDPFADGLVGVARVLHEGTTQARRVDLLWVVDNSGSMCQEQAALRENFSVFLEQLRGADVDLHVGITTTHAPAEGAPNTALVARGGHLQSEPQPVPGFDASCTGDAGRADDPADGYAPLRASLTAALGCLARPEDAAAFTWTDAQIGCALGRADAACAGVDAPDRNGDGRFDRFDLFPSRGQYRALPTVLRTEDYRGEDGALDHEAFRAAFACMSLVGTRGSGYEKGLQAAVDALSPTMTGGVVGASDADTSAPNHGLLRAGADLAMIFISDENDCSHDGALDEVGGVCGALSCDLASVAGAGGPLVPVETLRDRLLENLRASTGASFDPARLTVASIHGTWNQPDPEAISDAPCADSAAKAQTARLFRSCTSVLGTASSGDRYERFIRQFPSYYPNDRTASAPLDFSQHEQGWMCLGDFSPALEGFGKLIASKTSRICLQDTLRGCDADAACSPHRHQPDVTASCVDAGAQRFCDSDVVLVLQQRAGETPAVSIAAHPLCAAGTQGVYGEGSCVVDRGAFAWATPRGADAPCLEWAQGEEGALTSLEGYDLRAIYARAVTPYGDASARPTALSVGPLARSLD